MSPEIFFNICVPIKTKACKKWHVASCELLDVYSQGETKEKAIENLKEAIGMFIISCFERGTLDTVLKECGFIPRSSFKMISQKQPLKPKNCIDIPIPLYLLPNNKRQNILCHA
jgi:predicted RNase H-like HicB family nuclease